MGGDRVGVAGTLTRYHMTVCDLVIILSWLSGGYGDFMETLKNVYLVSGVVFAFIA